MDPPPWVVTAALGTGAHGKSGRVSAGAPHTTSAGSSAVRVGGATTSLSVCTVTAPGSPSVTSKRSMTMGSEPTFAQPQSVGRRRPSTAPHPLTGPCASRKPASALRRCGLTGSLHCWLIQEEEFTFVNVRANKGYAVAAALAKFASPGRLMANVTPGAWYLGIQEYLERNGVVMSALSDGVARRTRCVGCAVHAECAGSSSRHELGGCTMLQSSSLP